MEDSTRHAGRPTLTPAVIAAALFTVACAAIAVTFVAARGGLQLPLAPGASRAAIATAGPSPASTDMTATYLTPSDAPPTPTPAPTAVPGSPNATPARTALPTPAGTPDPLAALPACPDIEGCFEYVVRPGDSLSGVASTYVIPVWVVLALNPELLDASTIVIGQTLYLGRDPFLRMAACPGQPDCSLYEVRAGDGLSAIAGRFGLTLEAVLAANPEITDANAIRTGDLIRLPHPAEQPTPG